MRAKRPASIYELFIGPLGHLVAGSPVQNAIKQVLKVIILGSILVPFQFEIGAQTDGVWSIGLRPAHAESGSGRDDDDDRGRGRGRGGDDNDRDEDDRGDGVGDDDDGDDDDRDDDDREHDASEDRDDDRDDDTSRDRQRNVRLGSEFNISLQYTNGWREWVKDGRYVLIDPEGRTVANRAASRSDVTRMRNLAGQ